MVKNYLENEAISMIGRLTQLQPFSLGTPMVPAANVSDEAFKSITDHLLRGGKELRESIHQFVERLNHSSDAFESPAEAQAPFALLKLRFNAILDQLDIFADVISQRSEHATGVWIAGLDVLAMDALRLRNHLYEPPPVMCFLERGHGAAIRRARTRLPGGDPNPVAIIQVPRERMVGSSIASSLIHEVGHQGAALLNLVESLRVTLTERLRQSTGTQEKLGWQLYHLWISEIVADFWAMGHLGVGATLGLMGVVSLPKYFMFRIKLDDPHPFPWIRVKLSLAFGKRLFPHPQWDRLERIWEAIYPTADLGKNQQYIIRLLEEGMPDFVETLVGHQNSTMKEATLLDLFPVQQRQPNLLRQLFNHWQQAPQQMNRASPSLVFAVVGQARADNRLTATAESKMLSRLLTQWALARAEGRTTHESAQITQEIQRFIN